MILRRADKTDLDSIYDMSRSMGYAVVFAKFKYVLEGLLADPARDVLLVVDGERRIVGLMCLHHAPRGGAEDARVTIQELMIHPGYDDRGIAEKLVRFAEQYSSATGASLKSSMGGSALSGLIRRCPGALPHPPAPSRVPDPAPV